MFHSLPHDATPIDLADVLPAGPRVRALRPEDGALVEAHLLRLDPAARRLRFGALLRDEAVRAYARRASASRRIGLFDGAELRGLGELHVDPAHPADAEAAFSLEAGYRRQGFGTQLFGALLDEARRAGLRRLTLQCLRENVAMQRIARRFAAELAFEGGESVATLRMSGDAKAPAPVMGAPFDWLRLAAPRFSSPLPA